MNKTIQELAEAAGFVMWDDEEWGPGPGHVDWNSDYTEEFAQFLKLLSDCIYEAVINQLRVDDYGDSLDTDYDQAWQLGFNAGLIVAAAEANKILTGK